MYKKCLHTIMSVLLLYCVLNSAFAFKTLHVSTWNCFFFFLFFLVNHSFMICFPRNSDSQCCVMEKSIVPTLTRCATWCTRRRTVVTCSFSRHLPRGAALNPELFTVKWESERWGSEECEIWGCLIQQTLLMMSFSPSTSALHRGTDQKLWFTYS